MLYDIKKCVVFIQPSWLQQVRLNEHAPLLQPIPCVSLHSLIRAYSLDIINNFHPSSSPFSSSSFVPPPTNLLHSQQGNSSWHVSKTVGFRFLNTFLIMPSFAISYPTPCHFSECLPILNPAFSFGSTTSIYIHVSALYTTPCFKSVP